MSLVTSVARRVTRSSSPARVVNEAPVPMSQRIPSGVFALEAQAGSIQMALEAFGHSGVLFAIVDKLAMGVSSVNWRLYRQTNGDPVPVADHPALVVLNRPNPFMTRQLLLEMSQQHQDLTGESWWVIGRNPRLDIPLELWPVRPDRMQPVPHPTEYISGYVYTAPSGERVPLEARDVIFIRRPNPADPYRGIGPAESIMSVLLTERYSSQWSANYYKNGALPGGIIEIAHRLSEKDFRELADRWRMQHQGVANAHRVSILEQATWKDVRSTQRDMQMVEVSQLSDERVRQAFGFPKPLLGAVDDVNRANADAANHVFAQWCIIPRLERIKSALNTGFLPLFPASEGLYFDYESPALSDPAVEDASRTARVDDAIKLLSAGMAPDAVLNWLQLPEDLLKNGLNPPVPPVPPTAEGALAMLHSQLPW